MLANVVVVLKQISTYTESKLNKSNDLIFEEMFSCFFVRLRRSVGYQSSVHVDRAAQEVISLA